MLDGLGCLSRVLEVNSVKTIFNNMYLYVIFIYKVVISVCLSIWLVGPIITYEPMDLSSSNFD